MINSVGKLQFLFELTKNPGSDAVGRITLVVYLPYDPNGIVGLVDDAADGTVDETAVRFLFEAEVGLEPLDGAGSQHGHPGGTVAVDQRGEVLHRVIALIREGSRLGAEQSPVREQEILSVGTVIIYVI